MPINVYFDIESVFFFSTKFFVFALVDHLDIFLLLFERNQATRGRLRITVHLYAYVWLQMTNCSLESADRINEKIKMPKLWNCIAPKNDEEKKRKQINKQINAKLKQDEKIYKATYRLLLLGLHFKFLFIYLIVFLF